MVYNGLAFIWQQSGFFDTFWQKKAKDHHACTFPLCNTTSVKFHILIFSITTIEYWNLKMLSPKISETLHYLRASFRSREIKMNRIDALVSSSGKIVLSPLYGFSSESSRLYFGCSYSRLLVGHIPTRLLPASHLIFYLDFFLPVTVLDREVISLTD